MASYVTLFSLTLQNIIKRQLLLKNEFFPQVLTWATCWWTSVHWPPFFHSSLPPPLCLSPSHFTLICPINPCGFLHLFSCYSFFSSHPLPFSSLFPSAAERLVDGRWWRAPDRVHLERRLREGDHRNSDLERGLCGWQAWWQQGKQFIIQSTDHTMKPWSCCQI